MIEVRGLVFDYLGHRALHGVSVSLPKGTVTALVGPNGAGKSTLMRCMAGLDTPLAGSITVDGVDVQEHPREVHAKLGYLSDFFGLYTELTVAQCLSYAAAAQGMGRQRVAQRVQEVAGFLNLSDKLQSLSSNLSRGQRQRVAIGQAIVHAPQVLLLDEPASGLDPEARADLSVLFRTLQASGMTLVVSSHILSELDEYCTHILAIREGRISRFADLSATNATGVFAAPESAPAQDAGPARSLVQIHLAAALPAAQLSAALAGFEMAGYELAQLDATGAAPTTVYLPAGDKPARAALLAQLTAAGVPVCAFHDVRTRLQDSYKQTDSRNLQRA